MEINSSAQNIILKSIICFASIIIITISSNFEEISVAVINYFILPGMLNK